MKQNNIINQKTKEALNQIKVNDCKWFVPNRKMLKMNIKEFIEFERQRILEFENEHIRNTKYKKHFEPQK